MAGHRSKISNNITSADGSVLARDGLYRITIGPSGLFDPACKRLIILSENFPRIRSSNSLGYCPSCSLAYFSHSQCKCVIFTEIFFLYSGHSFPMSASQNSAVIQPSRCPLSKPIIIKHNPTKNVPYPFNFPISFVVNGRDERTASAGTLDTIVIK